MSDRTRPSPGWYLLPHLVLRAATSGTRRAKPLHRGTLDPSALTPRRTGAIPLLLIGALSACSDGPSGIVPPEPFDVRLALEIVSDGFDAPVFVTAPPGDTRRLFVVEQPGRIRVVLDGSVLATPALDLTSTTSDGGERGLLSVAFHPDYDANGFVFVNHTDNRGDTRILRFTASSPDQLDLASEEVVLVVGQPFANHNGGQIAFGRDGMLYIGMGDGGSGGDPQGHGQDLGTLLGALLRIEVNGALPYRIPSDNPFVARPGAAGEIWSYGLRNPWRFSFDGATGDLFIGDVGQNRLEEISWAPGSSAGGENFGWSVLEGSSCFNSATCDSSAMVLPILEYDHADGCSVTGGYVYRGSMIPELTGRYFFGDFCDGWIRSFRPEAGGATDLADHSPELGSVPSLASFGEDAAGELYVTSLNGTVYRIVAG